MKLKCWCTDDLPIRYRCERPSRHKHRLCLLSVTLHQRHTSNVNSFQLPEHTTQRQLLIRGSFYHKKTLTLKTSAQPWPQKIKILCKKAFIFLLYKKLTWLFFIEKINLKVINENQEITLHVLKHVETGKKHFSQKISRADLEIP